jgi:Ser/Thr protein kinase RdoA (MazF antagonist)
VYELLAAWGEITVTGVLGGGNRNTVLEVRRGDERLVARESRRSPASLEWEIGLLDHLGRQGMRVPQFVPALNGRRHIGSWAMQSWLDGDLPRPDDWPAVAAELSRLHQLTTGWPQRPGFASTRELLSADRGGDVDLAAMPAAAVRECCRSWAQLAGRPEAAVHGDPGPANIRITSAGVGLLDWDEARVDYTDLDLAELPLTVLPPEHLARAQAAATAWEAANGWLVEPAYARQQLALLLAGKTAFGPDRK